MPVHGAYITYEPYRALKTGGAEVSREKWDEADPEREDAEFPARGQAQSRAMQIPPPRNILPDWTKLPLPMGAPSASKKDIGASHGSSPLPVGSRTEMRPYDL